MRTDHVKEITKLIAQGGYRYHTHDVFSDCVAAMALSVSNSVDFRHRDAREKRYLEIVNRYDKEIVDSFPKVMAHVVMALEDERQDVLGKVFRELELHNKWRGQYFTPQEVCDVMARMTVGDGAELSAAVERRGFVTAHEPAVGSGAMVIALAEAMRAKGINYQQQLHVQAIDVDERAAQMAYVQFSLLHIPAEVIVGNTLSGEVRDRWFTPAHVLDGWTQRLAVHRAVDKAMDLETAVEREGAEQPARALQADIVVPIVGEQGTLFDVWDQQQEIDDAGVER